MVLMTLLLCGADPRTLQELEVLPGVAVAKLGTEGWGRQSWEAAAPASSGSDGPTLSALVALPALHLLPW